MGLDSSKLLLVGCDKGAWQIRGRQLGDALGARWSAKPKPADWARAEVIVLVKRAAAVWFEQARTAGRRGARLVWDVLDYWPQPAGNQRPLDYLAHEIGVLARELRVGRLVGATQAMASAIGGDYLPHHHRLGLVPGAVRERLEVVAYEGSERYLGPWRPALEAACAERGLRFVINPDDLRDADLVVAFRGGKWDGPVCRRWKSGVKLVNALVAGRPVLTQPSAAVDEIKPVGQTLEALEDLGPAIDAWRDPVRRTAAVLMARRRAEEFDLLRIADRYRHILRHA